MPPKRKAPTTKAAAGKPVDKKPRVDNVPKSQAQPKPTNASNVQNTPNPDATGPLYEALPSSLTSDPAIPTNIPPLDRSTTFTKPFVMNSLLHHQPSNIAANNYDHKVKNRVLLVDNPPAPDALQHTRREQRAQQSRKRKSKTMSAKERKESGAWDVPKKECKFQQFVPLHALWKGYISELFADCGSMPPQMVLPRMLKADYHGAQLSVAKAKCPTFVGLSGIVVKETENMFIIVTPKDAVKTIPKKGTVFTFVANNKIFTLYGNQFCFRAGERAARKFKDKPTVDL